MITCNLMGGLGNQIFQIFATISYAVKSTNKFHFLYSDKLIGGGSTTIRYTFWDSFFNNLKPFLIYEIPLNIEVVREKRFSYDELPIYKMENKNIMLYGYFQSYKYFQENFSLIYRLIGMDKMKNALFSKLNLEKEQLENTISMHFRIGDYKEIQHCHPLATYTYYENAITHIKLTTKSEIKYNLLYFCEDVDIDEVTEKINKLKVVFSDYTFSRGENTLEDWEQMLFMSCCHHNIIANSSFSWWGAYFNSWNDKIICYPSVWFGEPANIDTKDLCPPQWIKIIV